ncbi:hypothetical protein C2845_PM09G04530 [Panicum miliaceum]|uniref:Uncharacterized protein n=1 Tax=Panicum miliaceum TaxID=4540 RepID=A0A3L6RZT2_PANMI|nr:hypothetical protein C2845_PM09G04530 [Panicum miliaceum]
MHGDSDLLHEYYTLRCTRVKDGILRATARLLELDDDQFRDKGSSTSTVLPCLLEIPTSCSAAGLTATSASAARPAGPTFHLSAMALTLASLWRLI